MKPKFLLFSIFGLKFSQNHKFWQKTKSKKISQLSVMPVLLTDRETVPLANWDKNLFYFINIPDKPVYLIACL